jgi:tetratricopeptide (TPR) repeat protein
MANWPKRYYFKVKNAILDLRICKLTKLGIDRLRQKIKFSNTYKSDIVKNIKPESVEYSDRAHELWEPGKNNLAKDYYEKAIDIDPNNELAYIRLAHIYYSNDQYNKTLDLLTELMRINPYTSAREEVYRLLFLMYQNPSSPRNKINSLVKKIPSDESFKNPGMAFVLSQDIIAKNLEHNLEKMIPLIKSKKAIMILQLYAYPFLANRVLRSVSENHNILLVDNEKIFECFKDSASYYYNNNHPNENGYQLIAKNVYQVLDKIYNNPDF